MGMLAPGEAGERLQLTDGDDDVQDAEIVKEDAETVKEKEGEAEAGA